MADAPPTIHHHHHGTTILNQIAVDYCPEACIHHPSAAEIHVAFDHRGGARWRSTTRFRYGTFGARIRCPGGNTSGLNYNIYLSSLEGDKSQDEIDFEFLGKDNTSVQTNFYTVGSGGREQIHQLGFDASEDFHEYLIKWGPELIEWVVDGEVVRREERKEGEPWPEKPMFLYASVWDASYIDKGRWTGEYVGSDAPYVCKYKDVRVPIENVVIEEEGEEEKK
ncbi:probable xyloglucan endotransglucosylase/hydrolase protein 32 [Typha latifolia]|uniref:probable xyloglucan endotransglucosylase/hydrolase protein 32 n=1 Tax=Typha latifolia TaxID=4733 RepID=UPI003C2AD322